MKIKRILSSILVGCLLCVAVAGCTDDKENNNSKTTNTENKYLTVLPSAMTEDYVVCMNKLDLEIVKETTMMPSFKFHILSKNKLSEGDVKVNIDTGNPYKVLEGTKTECKGKFEEDVCLQYNNMDWEKLEDAESTGNDEDYLEYKANVDSKYDSLSDDNFPKFYDNEYSVQFNSFQIYDTKEINEVEVKINDFSTKMDIGSITFFEYESSNSGDNDLNMNSAGFAGVNIAGNTKGIIGIPAAEATTKKDIVIKDIYLKNSSDTISIDKVDIDLSSDDGDINQEWTKGEDFEIEKGTDVSFNFRFKDTKFAENLNYAVNIYVYIEYESNGKRYVAFTQAMCETEYISSMLYVMYNDNIDFTSYYDVYSTGFELEDV